MQKAVLPGCFFVLEKDFFTFSYKMAPPGRRHNPLNPLNLYDEDAA